MIDYDGRFWNAYYLEAVKVPSEQIVGEMGKSMLELQLYIDDKFTPIVRRTAWALEDFWFTVRLLDEPWWRRPLLRLAYIGHWIMRRWRT